jgi:hypothetical protein
MHGRMMCSFDLAIKEKPPSLNHPGGHQLNQWPRSFFQLTPPGTRVLKSNRTDEIKLPKQNIP